MPTTPEHLPYRDTTLATDARLDVLLERMTLDEKLAQIGCVWSSRLLAQGAFDTVAARELLAHGVGHVTRIGGATVLGPRESATFTNAVQRFLVEETRLGIPAIVHEESCAGYTAKGATCFPQAIGLAATFAPDLVERMTRVIREQMLAVGARHTLAPVLDVARDPRWGRLEETFGEDPWLIAQMGIAYVRGIQSERLATGVAATGKHFVGYGASEGGMNWAPAHLGPRELRDVYVFPFEAAIRLVGLASIMNAYHELDGVPCGGSQALLRDLLRGELGFDGVVVADYFTVDMLHAYHRFATGKGDAARRALEAGLDVELPAIDCFGVPLRDAVERGAVPVALVDRAVRRLLRIKFELGLFEQPFVDAEAAPLVFDTEPQRALARELGRKSIVLLRNEGGVLPLSKTLRRLAVIGPSASSIRVLQGDYHYPSHLEIVFGAIREDAHAPAPREARGRPRIDLGEHFPHMVSLLDGIRAAVSPATEILVERGCDLLDAGEDGIPAAVAVAREADVAIVCVGGKSGLVDGCTSGESVDRCTLGLPGAQQALVEAVASTGVPTVVVLVDGRPLAIPWIAEHVAAVLHVWLPGEEGGHAVADVLFGDADPGGRLPVSMPRSVGQLPVFYGHKPSGGRSHWKGTYADGPVAPLFPFGHGLSYARFRYANLTLSRTEAAPDDVVEVGCEVTNVASRAGEEVVQLYVQDVVGSVTRPVQELRGFARVALAPGETARVVFELAVRALAFHDVSLRRVVEPGTIEVMVGASSDDVRLMGRFEIAGATTDVGRDAAFTTPVRVERSAGTLMYPHP
ncbi:MAG TPA: glycoside hydrolase family 3 N-terminal domain-containing protein [Candidatus Binatia bacterium]|nr:glycoside hydrolase family 3 N-terminal domain-containing protein [Candidatus Binatia bacterium]